MIRRLVVVTLFVLTSLSTVFAETIRVPSDTPAHAEANSTSEILVTVPKNTKLNVLQRRGDWTQVQLKLKRGFEFSAWIRTSKQPAPEQAVVRQGQVTYVTGSTAYINLGSQEGVREGEMARSSRNEKKQCRVTHVADHSALCTSETLRAGETVIVRTVVPQRSIQKSRPATLAPSELIQRFQVLVSKPFAPVDYKRTDRRLLPSLKGSVDVSASHGSWISEGRRSFQREELALSIYDAPLGGDGWTATFDSSAWIISSKPDGARFRPDDNVQAYIYETSVRFQPAERGLNGTGGRIRTAHLPGIVMLDGGQVGYSMNALDSEIGLYGGVLPDIITLAPEADFWTAGAYFSSALPSPSDLPIRQEIRLGLDRSPADSGRLSIGTRWSAQWKRVADFGVETEFGIDRFDYVSLDVGVRATEKLRLFLDGRVTEHEPWDATTSYASRHANASTVYEVSSGVQVAALTGWMKDQAGENSQRAYAGPEVRFPGLLGKVSRLTVGAQEEFGWLSGRTGYLFVMREWIEKLRTSARTSIEFNRTASGNTTEWGGGFNVDWTLLNWLTSRLFASVRGGGGPLGSVGGIDLHGNF